MEPTETELLAQKSLSQFVQVSGPPEPGAEAEWRGEEPGAVWMEGGEEPGADAGDGGGGVRFGY